MIPEPIVTYVTTQSCATVSCISADHKPYCFNCFYTFLAAEGWLIFKSSQDTAHATMLLQNPQIAGSILPDKLTMLHIRGLQFEGELLPFNHPAYDTAAKAYYKQHPIALTMSGDIWVLQLNHLKLTDNRLGIGNKQHWQRA
jgi:uncharacterized protein